MPLRNYSLTRDQIVCVRVCYTPFNMVLWPVYTHSLTHFCLIKPLAVWCGIARRFHVLRCPDCTLLYSIIDGCVSINIVCLSHLIRSFVLCGRGAQPTLDPSAETFWIGPMRQPRERRRTDRCVWCERHVGLRRESRLELYLTSVIMI